MKVNRYDWEYRIFLNFLGDNVPPLPPPLKGKGPPILIDCVPPVVDTYWFRGIQLVMRLDLLLELEKKTG